MRSITLAAMLVAFAGCSTLDRQPTITSAGITPNRLQPGNTAVISAEIDDRFGIVSRVKGKVKEDPSMDFTLKDDGVPPDAEAGDGIWTMEVKVPFNAPPGDFEFTVTAYDDSGQPIVVRDEQGDVMPLDARFSLRIEIPPQT